MGGATAEILSNIRAAYGLDKPLLVQLAIYLGHVARGDLGMSYYFNQPVIGLIAAGLLARPKAPDVSTAAVNLPRSR